MLRPWPVRVLVQAARRFQIDRCTLAASSLAYQTSLALVPLLAGAFALLKASRQLDARSALLNFLGHQILPSSEEAQGEIVQRLASFSDNVAAGALGGVALAFTLVTGFLLYLNVEEIWNRIFSALRRRSYVQKFLLFYALVTLLPFLVALSLYYTASLFARLSLGPFLLSLLPTPVMFVLANRMLPVARVRWRSALLGGLCSALFFELAKYGFGLYLASALVKYRSIYGALGTVPLFLVWIYTAWVTVLWGAELTHAAERLEALEAAAGAPLSQDGDDSAMLNGPVAARVMLEVARHFAAGRKALPANDLRRRHRLSEGTLMRILRRLVQCNFLVEVDEAFLPARPLSAIKLEEVLEAFYAAEPHQGEADALAGLLSEMQMQARERIRDVTLAELV